MPAQPTIPTLLLLLLLLLLTTLSTTASLRPTTPRPLSRPPRVQCDPRTKPPTTPSPQDCATFLSFLATAARREPPGTYKYYARNIGTCDECVDLPAVLHFGRLSRCATVVDVDDGEDETALSIFGLGDLWEALEGVVQRCWLKGDVRKRCNGRGYPANFPAWAGFVRGVMGGGGEFGGLKVGNRTVSVIDLEEGWIGSARKGEERTGVDAAEMA